MSLFAPAARDRIADTLSPSEVRSALVEARNGIASPLLRNPDGSDARTAIHFPVNNLMFCALSADEAQAGHDVIAALHSGKLHSFVDVGEALRILPPYWEPRHDALDRNLLAARINSSRSQESLSPNAKASELTILWGEDLVGQHSARPIPDEFRDLAVLIPRAEAAVWIEQQLATSSQPVSASLLKTPEYERVWTRPRKGSHGTRVFSLFAKLEATGSAPDQPNWNASDALERYREKYGPIAKSTFDGWVSDYKAGRR